MLNPEHLGFPDEETLSCQDGLVENHHYRDLRWMTLEDFDRLWAAEQELLTYEGDLDTDEADARFSDNEVYLLGLDPGVASTVAALAAAGAVPVTSCAGGPGHSERHPLVLFWAEAAVLAPILAAAEEAGVFVEGVTHPGLLAYTFGDVALMQNFARALVSRLRATTESAAPAPPRSAHGA